MQTEEQRCEAEQNKMEEVAKSLNKAMKGIGSNKYLYLLIHFILNSLTILHFDNFKVLTKKELLEVSAIDI